MNDEFYMHEALEEAKKAMEKGEVPIGAVIVKNEQIIARAHNIREDSQIATHHAEILAIEQACIAVGSWRLEGCQLYVTIEPCPMCSGAIIQSRIEKVIFGAYDYKGGTVGSIFNMFEYNQFNHKVNYQGSVLLKQCSEIISSFFKNIRNKKG